MNQINVPQFSQYGGELGAASGIIGGQQALSNKPPEPSIMQIIAQHDQEIKALKEIIAKTRQEIEFLRARLGI